MQVTIIAKDSKIRVESNGTVIHVVHLDGNIIIRTETVWYEDLSKWCGLWCKSNLPAKSTDYDGAEVFINGAVDLHNYLLSELPAD